MKKNFFCFGIVFLFILFPFVNAVSIGVSPGNINMNNLLRGGYAQRTIRITTNSNDGLVASFNPKTDINTWISFDPPNRTFSVTAGKPYPLTIIVKPPLDARSDSYLGTIDFVTERLGDLSGRAGGFVKAGVTARFGITVSDEEIRDCKSGAFGFDDLEIGFPLKLHLTINNDGNTRLRPKISFEIWDQNQEKIVMSDEFVSPKEILPTTTETIVQTFSNSLDIGQYFAKIYVEDCSSSSLLTFSVIEKGGILDQGIFERLINKLWVLVGEPVEIKAQFKNNGERTVSAKFVGDIKLDNKIIEIIETDEIDVDLKETVDIIHYFTPDKPGRYVINGKIYYNRKITYEKSSILNVNPGAEYQQKINIVPLIIYLALIMTIIYLIRRIIQIKKRRK
jgi:hypothetical protein